MFAAYAAWSAREIESQALATLAALAQISTPSAAHSLETHQLLVQKFAADRDRQKKPRPPLSMHDCNRHHQQTLTLPRPTPGAHAAAAILVSVMEWGRHFLR